MIPEVRGPIEDRTQCSCYHCGAVGYPGVFPDDTTFAAVFDAAGDELERTPWEGGVAIQIAPTIKCNLCGSYDVTGFEGEVQDE